VPEADLEKLHKQESYKAASRGLEGTIPGTLADSEATHFEEADVGLLKHHGSYQQDNRDNRAERRRAKLDKDWIYMVRTKIPGGRLTAEQYLAEDDLARRYGYGSLRITSRQGFQIHGVEKKNLKNVIRDINRSALTTLGACGDVNRNTLACPICDLDWREGLGMDRLAASIAEHLAPRSTAYYEVWCDGEKLGRKVAPSREEPIYGMAYLPRKFKIAIAAPEDNCVDLYADDLGLEVIHDRTRVLGYTVLVGGGLGFTFAKPETYPRLGTRLMRVPPEDVLAIVETIVRIQRDYGGRVDRHHARLKYLLDDRGLEWFKAELFGRLGRQYPEPDPAPAYAVEDHLGWGEDRRGRLWVGVHVESGRIADTDGRRLMTGLREVIRRFQPAVRLTPHQNIILAGLEPATQTEVASLLADHGVRSAEEVTPLRRRALACPALPTCGLALAEAERSLPALLDRLEALGDAAAAINIHVTGCPNSCVRTPNAEIGIAGRGPGKYALHVGGSPMGTRLAYAFRETIGADELPDLLHRLIRLWRSDAGAGESFGDWSHRLGREAIDRRLT